MARLLFASLTFVLLAALLSGCSTRSEETETRGHELFDLHCADCHKVTNPDLLKQPPGLDHLFMRKTLPSGAPANDPEVRKTILQGRGTMPAFDGRLREQDIDDLLKYLHTL